jgi:hypothetical protein
VVVVRGQTFRQARFERWAFMRGRVALATAAGSAALPFERCRIHVRAGCSHDSRQDAGATSGIRKRMSPFPTLGDEVRYEPDQKRSSRNAGIPAQPPDIRGDRQGTPRAYTIGSPGRRYDILQTRTTFITDSPIPASKPTAIALAGMGVHCPLRTPVTFFAARSS